MKTYILKPGEQIICGKRKIGLAHKGKFVSKKARQNMSDAHIGNKPTEETKRKLSDALKGNTRSLGYKHTMETRLKKSELFKGENNPNWLGGISFGKYCPKFNEKIKEYIRDKYFRRCFSCWKEEKDNGSKLSVHHIDYNKMQGCDNHEWHLIPLCKSCNSKVNKDREKWERHYRIILDML